MLFYVLLFRVSVEVSRKTYILCCYYQRNKSIAACTHLLFEFVIILKRAKHRDPYTAIEFETSSKKHKVLFLELLGKLGKMYCNRSQSLVTMCQTRQMLASIVYTNQ